GDRVKIIRWVALAAACLSWASFSMGQSVDAFLGFNTLITAARTDGTPKMGGGLYPSVGGDLIFLPHNLGVSGQVAWRGGQANYLGLNVRPIFWNFNLMWQPVPPGVKIRPDLAVGIGSQSLRVYTGNFTCGTFTGCTNYFTSSHLLLHAGLGVKVYLTDHIFLRPAVDWYNIRHNVEYQVPNAFLVGMAIGYTLGPSS
ncbi:MAG: hypothetical protein ACRD1L_10355, partial [Terriglobales bacterium]